MQGTLVYEVDGFTTRQQLASLLAENPSQAVVGVLAKGSQGVSWANPNAQADLDDAEFDNYLTGWLHYTEPGANSPVDEAAHVLSILRDRPLPLGIWVEVDDLGGKPVHEMGDWLSQFITTASVPWRPVVVVANPDILSQGVLLPAGTRVVWATTPAVPGTPPWAVRRPLSQDEQSKGLSSVYARPVPGG